MPMATIRPAGENGLYHIHFLDQHGGTDPGYGQGRPNRPDQGLPGSGGHPDHDLPGQGRPPRPEQGLPGSGGHPGNRPPGSGGGGIPDNELPDGPPPQVAPGQVLVMVRDQHGKWEYATLEPGSAPPKPVQKPQPPHPSGQPVPPTAQPHQGQQGQQRR